MLEQFPFRILGFHSDNGSEFLNTTVAKLLGTLLIEQTKSRPRQSNDNALVETKNGAVIRKHMGYSHIRADHAERIQQFYREHFNPYLNFHRPCAQPELEVDRQGRTRRVYRRYQTPLETLLSLPSQHSTSEPVSASPRSKAWPLSATPMPHDACSRPNAMTLCGMPFGLPHKAWKSLRDSHIPSASAAAKLDPIFNQKEPPLPA